MVSVHPNCVLAINRILNCTEDVEVGGILKMFVQFFEVDLTWKFPEMAESTAHSY